MEGFFQGSKNNVCWRKFPGPFWHINNLNDLNNLNLYTLED